LEQASASRDALHHELPQIKLENEAMVQQIMGLTKELQEAKDTQAKALLLLRRQRVQMFRDISAHAMEAALRLGVQGLSQPPAPEDDGAFLHFFG
jgi:hypothetical protein